MVVRTCPTCRGTGYIKPETRIREGGQCVNVDPALVIELFDRKLSCRMVAKKLGISAETARVIRNGTWAGFRRA